MFPSSLSQFSTLFLPPFSLDFLSFFFFFFFFFSSLPFSSTHTHTHCFFFFFFFLKSPLSQPKRDTEAGAKAKEKEKEKAKEQDKAKSKQKAAAAAAAAAAYAAVCEDNALDPVSSKATASDDNDYDEELALATALSSTLNDSYSTDGGGGNAAAANGNCDDAFDPIVLVMNTTGCKVGVLEIVCLCNKYSSILRGFNSKSAQDETQVMEALAESGGNIDAAISYLFQIMSIEESEGLFEKKARLI